MPPVRTRVVVGGVALCALAAGALVVVVTTQDEGPRTRADYCDPPGLVGALPRIEAVGVVASPGYEHVATVASALAAADLPDGRTFVAAKDGKLWQVAPGVERPRLLLDYGADLATGVEQGLLGVAVDPDGAFAYLDATFADGTARVMEYAVTPEGLDVASRRDVLVIDDPHPSHNGGRLAFDDAGRLLFAIGDGGNGDRTGASQDLGSLFGKLVRIEARPDGDRPYGIPTDNPFVGEPGAREEILALGFRNPWGWTIDPATGDLWVGDVGQLCREEISTAPDAGSGANFGWPYAEGAHEFRGPVLAEGGEPDDSVEPVQLGARPKGLVGPVLEYEHGDAACSVIGGVVYRGEAIPELDGTYLWADLCERAIHTLHRDGDRWVSGTLGGEVPSGIVSFAQRGDGEVYLLSLDEGLFQLTVG